MNYNLLIICIGLLIYLAYAVYNWKRIAADRDRFRDDRDRWRQTALNNADRLDEAECIVPKLNVAIHEARLSHTCDDYPISVTVAELEAILKEVPE